MSIIFNWPGTNSWHSTVRDFEEQWAKPLSQTWGTSKLDLSIFNAWPGLFRTEKNDKGVTYEIDLPGVTRENLSVSIEDGQLIIGTVRPLLGSKETMNQTYKQMIPEDVDSAKTEASLANGVLTVTIPLRAEAAPRTVKVNVK